jgi:hypothetical protein
MSTRRRRFVFVSYSSADRLIAEAVCAALGSEGIRTFLAHRDNQGGAMWDESLLDALEGATALVVIVSAASNASLMVKREIVLAASLEKPIVPFRVQDISPGRSIKFFLAVHHWIDAFPTPEKHFGTLTKAVRALLKVKPKPTGGGDSGLYPYMVARGPEAHKAFIRPPAGPWDRTIRDSEKVEDLRAKLEADPNLLSEPRQMEIEGELFPCALLSSGWWDKRKESKVRQLPWRDGLQEWLFHGFDLWGPSWDYTWDFGKADGDQPYSIAQIGDGDEANSIPVLLPASKAKKFKEMLDGKWSGVPAKVKGVLGHRSSFEKEKNADPRLLKLFGGLLDYCLWLDEDNKDHTIRVNRNRHPEVYSGYIWKCVAPQELLVENTPVLSDVYFLWEHANWNNKDAISYSLDALNHKEEQLRRRYGQLTLIQKSSPMIGGVPLLTKDAVYKMLVGDTDLEL